jgi:hypothetical protein
MAVIECRADRRSSMRKMSMPYGFLNILVTFSAALHMQHGAAGDDR